MNKTELKLIEYCIELLEDDNVNNEYLNKRSVIILLRTLKEDTPIDEKMLQGLKGYIRRIKK